MVEEAAKRGLVVEHLVKGERNLRFYRVRINGRYFLYESLPTGNSYNKTRVEWITNKWTSKKIMQKAGIATPHGKVVKNLKDALDYVKKNDFPVVIKPIDKSLCVGVTCNIRTFSELEKAIERVKKYKRFLIEKYIIGENYRVTVVDGTVVAVTHRLHPRIIGDGKHTIKELIDIKNEDPRRGETKNFSLHPIKVDVFTKDILRKKKLTLDSVPKNKELIVLNQKINLGSGADSVDVTDKLYS